MDTKAEAERLIKKSIKSARDNYKVRKILNEIFNKEFFEALSNPGYIIDKDTALTVCNALITICIDHAGMKEGSIMHIMGRRLMDYIELQESPGKTRRETWTKQGN